MAACQHSVEAQAAEPKATPRAPVAPTGAAEPTPASPPKGLADKSAREAASKAIAALPACTLKPTDDVALGALTVVSQKCSTRTCMRTCCNTCTFVAALVGNGPQRGLDANQFRQLFPSFPEQPLECEINEWNNQLKAVTIGVTLPESKGAESARGPVSICLNRSP